MSFNIIDKIKDPFPILEWKPKPTFRTEYEREKYWAEEKRRWIEGYNGFPGTFYHAVQEQSIKRRVGGTSMRTIARDCDLWIHEAIRDTRNQKKSQFIFKGRGLGLTTIGAGSLPNYFMRVHPGSTCLMTSHIQANISKVFTDKTMVTYEGYDPEIKPTILNKNETKSSVYLKVQVKYKDITGKIDVASSDLFCKETSDSEKAANGFSGTGAIYGFYDEIALHKRRKSLLQSSIECYKDENGELEGFLLGGGTVEANLSNDEIAELQALINDKDLLNANVLFCPFWWGKYMVNGHSNEKKAMEEWDKTYERLDKSDDKSWLRAHIKNNPRSFDDIFDLGTSGRWEDDVSEIIKIQTKEVIKSNIPITRCKLVDMGSNIETVVDNKGPVHILENPKQNIDYWLLIDGVATGKKSGDEEGSNVSGMIVKGYDPAGDSYSPVCIYTERPNSVEDSYRVLAAEAKYYNKFGGLRGINAEANASTADHFSTFLEKIGLGKYMVMRKDLSGKGHSNTKKFFQHVTVDVRDWQMRQANIFLRKYGTNIKMLLLLKDMMKPASENADVLDSWLMFFPTVGANFDAPLPPKKPIPPRHVRVFVKDANGAIRTEWKVI